MEVYWNRDNEDLDEAEGPFAELFRELRDKGYQVYADEPNHEEPEDLSDLNELYLEGIRQAYQAALEITQQYIESLRDPHQEVERILREYDDPEKVNIMLNYISQLRQLDMERHMESAAAMLEYAQNLNEMYRENRMKDIEFKIGYMEKFETEGFDLDPEEGPLWDQITREDILDHFYDN